MESAVSTAECFQVLLPCGYSSGGKCGPGFEPPAANHRHCLLMTIGTFSHHNPSMFQHRVKKLAKFISSQSQSEMNRDWKLPLYRRLPFVLW
jgi:hypothetical protein